MGGPKAGGKASKQAPGGKPPSCHVTTHVLDTSIGRPAAGVPISLHCRALGSGHDADIWEEVAHGVTNKDGRISDWLPPSTSVDPGLYRCIPFLQHFLRDQVYGVRI